MPRSSPRWRLLLYEKSVGICICYRPTGRGFSHCPIKVGRQRRSPRLYMQLIRPAIFLTKYRAECKIITYPRASTVAQSLTLIWKFARHFDQSRISADKRFSLCLCQGKAPRRLLLPAAQTPDRGFCFAVCDCKVTKIFWSFNQFADYHWNESLQLGPAGVRRLNLTKWNA